MEAEDGQSNSYFFFISLHIKKFQLLMQLMNFNFFFHSILCTCDISRLFLLLNKTWSASTTISLLESGVREMFPVGVVIYRSQRCIIQLRITVWLKLEVGIGMSISGFHSLKYLYYRTSWDTNSSSKYFINLWVCGSGMESSLL